MRITYDTLLTTLPASDEAGPARAKKIAERLAGLVSCGNAGYAIASTVTVTGLDSLTIIDTLMRAESE